MNRCCESWDGVHQRWSDSGNERQLMSNVSYANYVLQPRAIHLRLSQPQWTTCSSQEKCISDCPCPNGLLQWWNSSETSRSSISRAAAVIYPATRAEAGGDVSNYSPDLNPTERCPVATHCTSTCTDGGPIRSVSLVGTGVGTADEDIGSITGTTV